MARFSPKLARVFPLLLFAFVTIYMTYPVPFYLGSMVRGRVFDDVFEYVWYFYWYKYALFDLGISPLFHPDIFYPLGWNLGFAPFPPVYPLLLSPLTALVGPMAAYNITLLGACVVGAYGMYLFCRSIGASFWGSIVAGIAYAFYPQHQVALNGLLNLLLGAMWLPWVLYGLVNASNYPQQRGRYMILAAVAFSLSLAGAWQFVFIGSTAILIFILMYLAPVLRQEWRSWIRPFGYFWLVLLLLVAPWFVNGIYVRNQMGQAAVFSFENINHTAVSLERFFLPNPMNPPIWNLFRDNFPDWASGGTAIVSIGYLLTLLVIFGLVWSSGFKRVNRTLLAMAGAAWLLMLGPTIHLLGQSLSIDLSWTDLVQRVAPDLVKADGSVAFPMPSYLLYLFIPPFRSFHGFERWGTILSLSLSALAAVGLTRLLERYNRQVQTVLGMVVVLLIVAEFNTQPIPVITSAQEMRRSVDEWLTVQEEPSVIIEYPLFYTVKAQSLYYTAAHKQTIVHGYGGVLPPHFMESRTILEQWPQPEALDLLLALNVRYVLVNVFRGQDDFEEKSLPTLVASERVELVGRFPDQVGPIRQIYLFELSR
jgi:hypothetical protein